MVTLVLFIVPRLDPFDLPPLTWLVVASNSLEPLLQTNGVRERPSDEETDRRVRSRPVIGATHHRGVFDHVNCVTRVGLLAELPKIGVRNRFVHSDCFEFGRLHMREQFSLGK